MPSEGARGECATVHLSLPFALRFLLAARPNALTQVFGIVYRTQLVDGLVFCGASSGRSCAR